MNVRLIFEDKTDNITFDNKDSSFEEICKVIAGTRGYGLGNEMYVNTSKIVRIELVE